MCHLILLLPVLALPLFWVLPLGIAAPLYGLCVAVAVTVYYYAWETGHRPVRIGQERLVDAEGRVLDIAPVLRVEVDGAAWLGRSKDELTVGEAVHVNGREGLTLLVSKTAR